MKTGISAALLFFGITLSVNSQNVNLAGIVKNRTGKPVAGAEVTLKSLALKDTTAADGTFKIFKSPVRVRTVTSPALQVTPRFVDRRGIMFWQPVPGSARLDIIDASGKFIARTEITSGAGIRYISPGKLTSGVYAARLTTPGSQYSFRFVVAASLTGNGTPAHVQNSGTRPLPRISAAASPDSLLVARASYLPTAIAVTSLIDTTLSITLDSNAITSTAGCGKTITRPDPATRLTLSVSGSNRTYQLFIPTNYSPDNPLPLIFAFHGGGGTGAAARTDFKLEAATSNGAILVYPDGGWNYGTGNDVAFFDAMIVELKNKYCIDAHKIYVTGFSLGGIFVNGLGCLRGGSVVRGIIPVAGSGPNPNMGPAEADIACPGGTPTADIPVLIIHGTADANALYKYGQWEANYWSKWNGCSTTTIAGSAPFAGCAIYQNCRVPVYFYTHSGGHMVPQNTGALIWEFIKLLD